MTPTQQSALEALAGRSMTTAEISLATNRADAALAASLSAGRSVQGIVPTPVFAAWCASTGLRAVIEDTSKSLTSPMRSAALVILDLLSWQSGGLDLSNSAMGRGNLAMLAAWVSAGVVSAAQNSALMALAATPAPIDCNTVYNILSGV